MMMSMNPFLWLIDTVISVYFWIILAMVNPELARRLQRGQPLQPLCPPDRPGAGEAHGAVAEAHSPLPAGFGRASTFRRSSCSSACSSSHAGKWVFYSLGGRDLAAPPRKGGLLLSLRVTPKSSLDEVAGLHVASDGPCRLP